MDKKLFQPEDMEAINYLSGVAVSSDGRIIAYVSSKGSAGDGLFSSRIRLVYREENRQEELFGDGNQSCPVFLDDGTIAFLGDATGVNQIYTADLRSRTMKKVTSARHGVKHFSVSADRRYIAFDGDLWEEEIEENLSFKEMDAEERKAWQAELDMRPYEITDLGYKEDTWFGMRKGEKRRSFVVDLDSGVQRLIFCGGMETCYPAVAGGGQKVMCFGYPYSGIRSRKPALFLCDLGRADGNPVQIGEDQSFCADMAPVFTADGQKAVLSAEVENDGRWLAAPWVIDLSSGETTLLTAEEDEGLFHGVHTPVTNRTAYGTEPPYMALSGDEKELYFLSSFHGRESIYKRPLAASGKAVMAVKGETDIHSFAVTEGGGLAYLMGSLQMPAELYYEGQQITDSNRWLSGYEMPETEEFWVSSGDGETRLQVWLVHPVRQEADRLYPAVLYVRGGPALTYNADYWHEFHALASQGIAVIYTNPRGSLGYGTAFGDGAYAWGREAKEDLLTVVDACISKGFIDPVRIGVCGGSYGGYMTNRLIMETQRFAAAVSQRSMYNPATFYGCADGGYISEKKDPSQVKMLDYLKGKLSGAFICRADGVKTPLLILHGYRDYRCSFEQAEQLFISMKERNPQTPVRLVMFPEENHDINRTGKLYSQIRHLRETVDWLVKYLVKGGEENA